MFTRMVNVTEAIWYQEVLPDWATLTVALPGPAGWRVVPFTIRRILGSELERRGGNPEFRRTETEAPPTTRFAGRAVRIFCSLLPSEAKELQTEAGGW